MKGFAEFLAKLDLKKHWFVFVVAILSSMFNVLIFENYSNYLDYKISYILLISISLSLTYVVLQIPLFIFLSAQMLKYFKEKYKTEITLDVKLAITVTLAFSASPLIVAIIRSIFFKLTTLSGVLTYLITISVLCLYIYIDNIISIKKLKSKVEQ